MSAAAGFSVRPLPAWLRAANRTAAWAGMDMGFNPEVLMADAARSVGLPAKYPKHVEESLAVLCASLREEARLHWFGYMNMRTLLHSGLGSLLQIEHAFAQDPALAKVPLNSPIIVTGLPRSGTTYLHRLLSVIPEAEPVRLYQHVFPVPFRPLDYRRLRAEVEFLPWQLASQVYGMDAMHHVRPMLPDECNFGMRLAGRSMIYWATAPTHSYLRWLLAQDLRESYQLYRKALILHQLKAPGKRLTLKCPHHLAWLPALTEAIPEARIVMTHRDPRETVPSECKLVLSLQALSTHDLDWRRTVESNGFKVRCFAERAVAFSEHEQSGRVAHVPYRKLTKDPTGTARDIHAAFGLDFQEQHAESISDFANKNRQNKHGKNSYSAEQFGIDKEKLAAEYAPYYERFLGGA